MLVNGAIYTVIVPGISITVASGAGDILEVRTPTDAIIIPIFAWVSTEDEETSQQVGIEFATFATAGSGGVSVTPDPHSQHFIASQTVCLRNNTTDATGTQRNFRRQGANVLGAGWEWNGDGSVIVPISTSLVLGFVSALAADSVISAVIEFMELGQ